MKRIRQVTSALVLSAAIAALFSGAPWWHSLSGQTQLADMVFFGGPVAGEPGDVRVYNLSSRQERLFAGPSESFRIFDFKPAPKGSLIAVREQLLQFDVVPDRATFVEPSRSGPRPAVESMRLRILSTDGAEVDVLNDVRDYAWSPDGTQLVFVTGVYRGHQKEHSRTGTWMWSAADRSRRQISTGGYYVAWAQFDAHVYLRDPTREGLESVRRYDQALNTFEVTRHKSIYFSPSGDYYYHPGGGLLIRENVYLTASDVPLDPSSPALAALAGWRALG